MSFSGKVAYFTTLFPYVVLTILLAYVATLEGFTNGISYYLVPDWSKLWNIQIWKQAASQILFSLSVGNGSQLILASYNPFRNNAHRDALLIAICNALTSIFSGFVVFGFLGFMSIKKGIPIEEVVDSGPSLAFIVCFYFSFFLIGLYQFSFGYGAVWVYTSHFKNPPLLCLA